VKVSLKWLNEYVKIDDLDPQELADQISLHGVEVDAVGSISDAVGVVIGYVTEKKQHPDADKLSVCQVDLGSEAGTVQIVCGAKNVDAGQKVPVARNKAILPGGFKIKKTRLRGEESNGMICSLSELGVDKGLVPAEFADGILVLPEDAPIGANAIEYLNLNDVVLELGLTPNRMDMLSMYGVANDVAAILNRKPKSVAKTETFTESSSDFSITLQTEKCAMYLAKVVEGITVQSSNKDAQMQLLATGNKPINNIVDLTNQMMLQNGLPVHAFDIDKLPAREIIVRGALAGEKIVTLDEKERTLAAGDIVITSGDEIVAIAGIMGSASTAIDENTKNVLFEAAIFDRTQIRQTASRLNLRTNASVRFEKGIHVERIFETSHLIDEAFANVTHVKVGNFEATPIEIEISVTNINSKLGTNLTQEDITSIFDRLNLEYKVSSNHFTVTPSTRMLDVTKAYDLIEEIARIHGYNNIPETLPKMNTIGEYNKSQKLESKIHQIMQSCGLNNVVTYSLTHENKTSMFLDNQANEAIKLSMPLSQDRQYLRKSCIPGLLEVATYNQARSQSDIAIYEVGRIYGKEADTYIEEKRLAGLVTGNLIHSKWKAQTEVVDFYTAKGYVESLLESLGYTDIMFVSENIDTYQELHPGRTAAVYVKNIKIGFIGALHPEIKKSYDLNDTYVFELSIDKLEDHEPTYTQVAKHPGMDLDLAIVIDTTIEAQKLVEVIKRCDAKNLQSVEIFDIYTGAGIAPSQKSIALRLSFLDVEKTLTDEDILPVQEKILAKLESELGATLRT